MEHWLSDPLTNMADWLVRYSQFHTAKYQGLREGGCIQRQEGRSGQESEFIQLLLL